MKQFVRILFYGVVFALSACGESNISKNLTKSIDSSDSKIAASSANEVANATIGVWTSPARDGASNNSASTLTQSSSAVNAVTRSSTPLYQLQNGDGLKNLYLEVKNDTTGVTPLTKYSNYLSNKNVSWTNRDFQNFMGFASFSFSIKRAMQLFSSKSIETKTNSNGSPIFPLKVYVNECCNATATGYDPDVRDIIFFRHSDSSSNPYYRFNMIDESEVAHHEFGHVLQHALNRPALELAVGANPDIDLLLEGLSDFYAAAVMQSETVFPYMENNIGGLLSQGNPVRYSPSGAYKRNLGSANTLSLPNNFIWQSHLDGRIVAAALNDIRKAFSTSGVSSSCSKINSAFSCQDSRMALNTAQAFDETVKLAYLAFAKMTTNSSLQGYAQLLLNQWQDESYSSVCNIVTSSSTLENCRNVGKNIIYNFLVSRGLYRPIATAIPAGSDVMQIPSTLSYINHPLQNDGDSVLESCETVLVYPNVKNISSNVDLAHGWATLNISSLLGFTEVSSVETLDSTEQKIIPWLKPGEQSSVLIGSVSGNTTGRLFSEMFGSAFLRPFPLNTSNNKTSEVGWVLRAPLQGTASVNLYINFNPYNSNSKINFYSPTATQSITVVRNPSKSSCP